MTWQQTIILVAALAIGGAVFLIGSMLHAEGTGVIAATIISGAWGFARWALPRRQRKPHATSGSGPYPTLSGPPTP